MKDIVIDIGFKTADVLSNKFGNNELKSEQKRQTVATKEK
jgi:hypothetical protein